MEINTKDSQAINLLEKNQDKYKSIDIEAVDLCRDYLRVSKKVLSMFGSLFGEFDISPSKYSVLTALMNNPEGLLPSELASSTGITRGSMTSILNNLVKDNYIQRVEHPEDRRKLIMVLTTNGKKLVQEVLPVVFARMEEVVQPIGVENRALFKNLLNQIEEYL